MDYITMIFDLKNSRQIENRYEVQMELIDAIKRCNQKYKDIIASSFLITVGDEWEGLLKPGSDYRQILHFFEENLPANLRFYTGIGIGDISITNFELTVNQLDGPAFYMARDALKIAKKKNYKTVLVEYNTSIS